MNDLRKMNEEPFVINNQVYVLGNPVITTETLEQLVQSLDHLGLGQPIVIINPEAQVIPNFDQALSNLIQNNRTRQFINVTSEDKYKFKDFTDEQLQELVVRDVQANPMLKSDVLSEVYTGLRLRAQYLFYIDQLIGEKDAIWAFHCANPDSPEGSDRFLELQNKLIPEAQQYYDFVCNRLTELEQTLYQVQETRTIQAASETSVMYNNTQQQPTTQAATQETQAATQESNIDTVQTNTSVTAPEVKVWGPWITEDYLKMPLKNAKSASEGVPTVIKNQQRDFEVDSVVYKAVPLMYLLALGIPLYPDGVPIVYTKLGKFKRVGTSSRALNDMDYWYPTPRRL